MYLEDLELLCYSEDITLEEFFDAYDYLNEGIVNMAYKGLGYKDKAGEKIASVGSKGAVVAGTGSAIILQKKMKEIENNSRYMEKYTKSKSELPYKKWLAKNVLEYKKLKNMKNLSIGAAGIGVAAGAANAVKRNNRKARLYANDLMDCIQIFDL